MPEQVWILLATFLLGSGGLGATITYAIRSRTDRASKQKIIELTEQKAELERAQAEKIRAQGDAEQTKELIAQTNTLLVMVGHSQDLLQAEKRIGAEREERFRVQLEAQRSMIEERLAADAEERTRFRDEVRNSYEVSKDLIVRLDGYTRSTMDAFRAELDRDRAANIRTWQEFTQTTVSAFSVSLQGIIAQQQLMKQVSMELFMFPSADDPRWHIVNANPCTGEDAQLFSQPLLDERYLIDNAFVHPNEKVRVIDGFIKDWTAVMKFLNGSPPYFGWIPSRLIELTPYEGDASVTGPDVHGL